ncbi:MAG: L-threonylcarbamoyladenylate synthase [Erysipelotrichaceae bacterium]
METKRYQKKDLDEVVSMLKRGLVVAFPTDTVFGLGVIYDDETALKRLKEAKGRDENKPIPTMVGSIKQIEQIAEVSDVAKRLIQAFMPGAFTIILNKKSNVADYATNGFNTIGIRMPKDEFVLALIKACGKAMLVTSANISGLASTSNDVDALAQLDGRIDGIVLGHSGGNQASTIVDATSETIKIIRVGDISKEMIDSVVQGGQ